VTENVPNPHSNGDSDLDPTVDLVGVQQHEFSGTTNSDNKTKMPFAGFPESTFNALDNSRIALSLRCPKRISNVLAEIGATG
jgi:hypothetical protein